MTLWLRMSAWYRIVRGSLWLFPAIAVVLAVAAGIWLPRVEVPSSTRFVWLMFGGSPEGARAVLQVIASSTITVLALTFSLTVVALQMAATQFTPRVLRNFLRDHGNQAVLATFLATFAYNLTVLRTIRSDTETLSPFVPPLAVSVAFVLALVAVAMLVYFIHHLTTQLRVEVVMDEIQRATVAAAEHIREEASDQAAFEDVPDVPDEARVVRSRRAGYLQHVDPRLLKRKAESLGIAVALRPAPGEHVTYRSTLAWAWRAGGGGLDDEDIDLEHAVHGAIHLGPERLLRQDVAFGVRQLVDIGVKALSPGINDPTTAVQSIDQLSTVLGELARHPLGSWVQWNEGGEVVTVIPRPTFERLVDLAVDQLRRYGAAEPAVLRALLSMLVDVAERTDDPDRVDALLIQVDRIASTADRSCDHPDDRDAVRDAVEETRDALRSGRRDGDEPTRGD